MEQQKTININIKKKDDYPDIKNVYLDVAQNYSSPLVMGPPLCDELMALIQHMFTEEEASIARHLKPLRIKTAASIARAEHRPKEEVQKILDNLADKKCVIGAAGAGDKRRYFIMPLLPGTFEWVLMQPSMNDLSPWHKRFAELFDTLHDTHYEYEYFKRLARVNGASPVRYIPVQQSIDTHPMALPTDKLAWILDRYNTFAVTICQCRTIRNITGKDCGKPIEVCAAFGPIAEKHISKGKYRRIEKNELIEIKAQAEAHGLITWINNYDEKTAKFGNGSCSCCGCCCPVLGTITEFNLSGVIAPPHFRPEFDRAKCKYCGKCAAKCQMGALTVDAKTKTIALDIKRCIGCGQCTLGCNKQKAVSMQPVSGYKKVPKSIAPIGMKALPVYGRMIWEIWRQRKNSKY